MNKIILILLIFSTLVLAQTREQLRQALGECEADLQASLQKIEALTSALQSTDALIKTRQVLVDSLIANLQEQLKTQAQIRHQLQMNADTLQIMVNDYQKKLDELANLYRKELEKSSRPWIFTKPGIQGLTTGILIGGAVGLIYGLLH